MFEYLPANIRKTITMDTLSYPISVYFKITTKCMLNCVFCSQSDKKIENIDLELAKNVLIELKKIGVIYIYYTGGEPLLYKNVQELIKFGYDLGFKQILVTNGLLICKNNNLELLKYCISIGISLHGNKEMHNKLSGNINCFDEVINNLRTIKEKNSNIKININCTAIPENTNYDNLKFLAKLCKTNDWELTIARLNYIGNGKKYNDVSVNNLLEIIDTINREGYQIKVSNCIIPCVIDEKYTYLTHGCGAGQSIAAIEPNFDVKICASSNVSIGNLTNSKFKKIWNSKQNKLFWKMKWLPFDCNTCKYFLSCKGGCKAELSGKYWQQSCDALIEQKHKKIWNEIKDKKIFLNFSEIRKENNGYYTIVNFPARLCNTETINFIKKIDGKKTAEELISDDSEKNCTRKRNLLISMKEDGLISSNNNEV